MTGSKGGSRPVCGDLRKWRGDRPDPSSIRSFFPHRLAVQARQRRSLSNNVRKSSCGAESKHLRRTIILDWQALAPLTMPPSQQRSWAARSFSRVRHILQLPARSRAEHDRRGHGRGARQRLYHRHEDEDGHHQAGHECVNLVQCASNGSPGNAAARSAAAGSSTLRPRNECPEQQAKTEQNSYKPHTLKHPSRGHRAHRWSALQDRRNASRGKHRLHAAPHRAAWSGIPTPR